MANPAKLTVRTLIPNFARVWPAVDVIDTTGMVPVLAADTGYQPDSLVLVVTAKGAVSARIVPGDLPPSVRSSLGGLSVPVTAITASGIVAPAGANNDVEFTANTAGASGNDITVQYIDPGAPDQTLVVRVVDKAIRVHLATGAAPGAAITSTGAQVVAAVNAHWMAGHLVTAANAAGNSGAAAVTAMAAAHLAGGADMDATHATLSTALAGGNNDLVWTAVTGGEAGNALTVEYIDPAGADAGSIALVGNAIEVTLAHSGAAITATADDIKLLVLASPAVSAVVTAEDDAGNDGSGVVTAMAAAPLIGGADLTAIYGPFESARFAQDNGDLNVNFEVINGTADVICFQVPQ
jgi:hypothetical protein